MFHKIDSFAVRCKLEVQPGLAYEIFVTRAQQTVLDTYWRCIQASVHQALLWLLLTSYALSGGLVRIFSVLMERVFVSA